MQPTDNTILITGGGSGLGRAFAQRLHDLGNKVIVTGRKRDALEETARGREGITPVEFDVADPTQIQTFAQRIVREHPALNVLMNNAGIMRTEKLAGGRDLADAEATITTNLLGPIRLTNALVDHLAAQPHAAVMKVSSGLAFVPMPGAATYCATKAAVHSYTVSLRVQLAGKVEVVELIPPGVQTDLTPGQSTRKGYMPLEAFMDEAMGLLTRQPTPAEVSVECVKMLRDAEAEGRFDKVLTMLASR